MNTIKKSLIYSLAFLSLGCLSAQKKILQHEDKGLWNRLVNVSISNSGDHVLYATEQGEREQTLKLKDISGRLIYSHVRSNGGTFSHDSEYIGFTVNAWKDSIKEMKRRKIKEKDLPKDTLVLYAIKSKKITKIPNVKSYKMPEKWSGIVAYMLEEIKKPKDSTESEEKDTLEAVKKAKPKMVSKDNGYHLVVRDLKSDTEDTLRFVTRYAIAEESRYITYASTGEKGKDSAGVFVYDVDSRTRKAIFTSHEKTSYPQLSISESGTRVGFVADADSTKSLIKKPRLYAWNKDEETAGLVVDSEENPSGLLISADENLRFSEDEKRLFFGVRPTPVVQDTTLLDEEIVNVEVWTYDEPRLYTVQELDVEDDKKKAFLSLYDFDRNTFIQIADKDFDRAQYGDEGNSDYAVVGNGTPYELQSQWTAQRPMDLQRVNLNSGEKTPIARKVYGGTSISPKGKYLYGYSRKDSTWFTYNLETLKYTSLTKGRQFYNELHDYPDDPYSYGSAGWTENDDKFLIYDRFDIWAFDPETGSSDRITNGRAAKVHYRYVRLDEDERSISNEANWMLSTFNEETKFGGVASYDPKGKRVKQLIEGPYSFGGFQMAQKDKKERLLFTRQSFTDFPNVWSTNTSFKAPKQITEANPQQSQYNWGTAELVEWVSLDGKPLKGMLIKPENFDPNKKYPMIVNFYEKSSDGLYRHRAPSYGRSTINYPFYASRGYLIFNPDVYYRDGYPGESAFNCVIPGDYCIDRQRFCG
jgi:dipeptidyl aminopeptidase/acylaminoacyl peptidase